MFHSPRNTIPSKIILEERESSTKQNLEDILVHSTCVLNRENIDEIQESARKLKSACNLYEDASRNLSSWLSNHGHTEESLAVRRERHKLVYIEAKEGLRDLNSLLKENDLDTVSTIDVLNSISTFSEQPTQTKLQNVEHEIASQPTKHCGSRGQNC